MQHTYAEEKKIISNKERELHADITVSLLADELHAICFKSEILIHAKNKESQNKMENIQEL